jgi:hypothetical protein
LSDDFINHCGDKKNNTINAKKNHPKSFINHPGSGMLPLALALTLTLLSTKNGPEPDRPARSMAIGSTIPKSLSLFRAWFAFRDFRYSAVCALDI